MIPLRVPSIYPCTINFYNLKKFTKANGKPVEELVGVSNGSLMVNTMKDVSKMIGFKVMADMLLKMVPVFTAYLIKKGSLDQVTYPMLMEISMRELGKILKKVAMEE